MDARAALGRVDPADVRREFAAQVATIRAAGLGIGHLDTHQHTHLWPSVGRVVIELARDQGIGVVRRPRSAQRGPVGRGVRTLGRRLDRALAAAGLRSTDYYAGLDEAGALDQARLSGALLRAADAGARSVEVNCHPGEGDDPELQRFTWAYSWSGELDLLTAPGTGDTIRRLGYELARPGDLLTGPSS
ncbi:MAG: YdjC family protein [Jatrophihabitantaceae bacterium]|nr:YdjC family protein [Jatrophihabitantaceae bacterium]